jgi:hypothetical protein
MVRAAAGLVRSAKGRRMLLFEAFLWVHIAFGVAGATTLWIAMATRKGGDVHRLWGKVFAYSLLVTGSCAVGMSLCTLAWPVETHPKIADVVLVRAIFGWMMFYLGVLTISLCWHGLKAVRNKSDHARNRHPFDVALQLAVIAAAANCALQGWLSGWSLMIGMSLIGFASAGTNLLFMFTARPWRLQYLVEHFKALVGAGISVYTAFLAFGAVRLLPSGALSGFLWFPPIVIGVATIVWWRHRTRRMDRTGSWREHGLLRRVQLIRARREQPGT